MVEMVTRDYGLKLGKMRIKFKQTVFEHIQDVVIFNKASLFLTALLKVTHNFNVCDIM